MIDTAAIIDRLGGTAKAATLCGVSPGAVTLWKRAGIPPAHWLALVRYAGEAGIEGVTFDTIQAARDAAKAA